MKIPAAPPALPRFPRPGCPAGYVLLLLLALPCLTGFAGGPGLRPTLNLDVPPLPRSILAQFRAQPPPPEVSARGVLIRDVTVGVDLYAKEPDERLAPGSTTKLLTALLVIEHGQLETPVTLRATDYGPDDESRMSPYAEEGLVPGDVLTLGTLLDGIILVSGGEAARAAARTVGAALLAGGSGDPQERFVAGMNARAVDLGLVNTHFVNPDGYPIDGHYSSARDLLILAEVVLRQQHLAALVAAPELSRATADGQKDIQLRNVNALLAKRPGIHGVKTGTVEPGQYENLIAAQWGPGGRILAVVLGSTARYAETTALVDWLNVAYRWLPLGRESLPAGLGPALERWGVEIRDHGIIVLPTAAVPMLRYHLLLWEATPGAAADAPRGRVVFTVGGSEVLALAVYPVIRAAASSDPDGRPQRQD